MVATEAAVVSGGQALEQVGGRVEANLQRSDLKRE
jgi:hypothetical protein